MTKFEGKGRRGPRAGIERGPLRVVEAKVVFFTRPGAEPVSGGRGA